MKTISIDIPEGKTAEWVNGVLTLVDENKIDQRTIQEKVQSYEDAVAVLGEFVLPFDKLPLEKDEIAYIKLKTIVKALNEGWEPELKKDENRYYPWYYLYTKEEINDMEQDEKDKRRLIELWAIPGKCNIGEIVGFGYAHTNSAPSYTCASANVGSRLCLKNEELATYCGKKFIELWFEFYFPERSVFETHNI